ncbi:hypothetical protein BBJ28_00007177 [Nothophytophthora sp. Chile5]|nr:hypothetical protein BBJ28_00007177 [Nothophytophthora sp. Chile5]
MQRFLRSVLLAVVIFGALSSGRSNAAECTDSEAAYADQVWQTAATTSACSQYATQTNPVYVSAPCTATSCVAVMEQVAADLPDCTYSGVNNKIEVENALTVCNGGSTTDPGSVTTTAPSTDAPSTDAPSTDAPSTDAPSTLAPTSTASNTDCTTSEVNDMWNSFITTATSSACADDSTVNAYSIYIDTLCSSACTDQIKTLAEDLPNCYYEYEFSNKKQEALDAIDSCSNPSGYTLISMFVDDSFDSSSTTSTPAATAGSTTDGTSSTFGALSGASTPSSSVVVFPLWLVAALLTAVRLQ